MAYTMFPFTPGSMASMLLIWSALLTPLLALPADNINLRDDFLRTRSPSFEWTAWGDSYASGVGAGSYVDGRRCLRYKEAYPVLINDDPEELLMGSGGKFNNVVCSGATAKEVEEYQFYDRDQTDKPNLQYSPRPAIGKPTMGTLTVGGDDIDFPGILNNCIVEGFPFPLGKGFTPRSCTDQRALSWALIAQDGTHSTPNNDLVAKIDSVIKKIVTEGKKNTEHFKLYVTGYGQFFNDEDPYCDGVTFARNAKPNDGKNHVMMTRELRRDFNAMSKMLNIAIKQAIERNSESSTVKYIDVDAMLNGNRFCEPGVKEPDQDNTKSAFFHYPYSRVKEDGPVIDYLNQVASTNSLSWDPKQTLWRDYMEDFWSKVDEQALKDAMGDVGAQNTWDVFFRDFVGPRVKIFHPRPSLHANIYEAVVRQYLQDEASEGGGSGGGSGGGGGAGGQQIAIASYTNPLGDPAAWQRLISYDSSKLSVLVANVLNGPDYVVDSSWNSVIQQAAGSGKTVLGYVRTGYLGVSQHKFKTRLGSGDLADWASQIEQDVDKWFELYPGGIGGIFFDEGWPECGPTNIYSDLYAHINAYTKRKHPGAFTVLNPGSKIAQCYEDTMDTLLTYESSYETYTSSAYNDLQLTWTPKDDRKIWHIIYRVPLDKVAEVAKLSRERHVGYLEVTDDDNTPNPYDVVPRDEYMKAEMNAVSGGKVLKNAATVLGGSYVAGVPSDANVIASDYTSATITWSSVAGALGYAVYQNGALVLEIPPSLQRATVGFLKPGSSASFEVKTVLSSGGGGSSRSITASTKSLPSGGSIANVKYTKSGDNVIYTADVLVPYAFVRLFIGGPHKAVGASSGWPIDAGLNNETGGAGPIGQYKLVNYLVEGNDFYSPLLKYTGSYVEGGSGNADWSWSEKAQAPQSQSGYTYTWNVPLGGTDAMPDDYVVQGQGYAPIQNVFGGSLRSYKCAGQPCDDNPDYDCKGSSLCTTPDLLKWCDIAVNNLTRTDDLTYGTSGGKQSGGCWGDGVRSCGVFLQGSNCAMSGNDMWKTYQNLRNLGGCSKCGSYHRDDGCLLTVNYVSYCDIGLPDPEVPPAR